MTLARRTASAQRALRATLLAASCAVAAGCEIPHDDWSGVRQAPHPHAEVATFRHTIQFEPGSARMRDSEQHRWEAFLQKVRPESADTVLLSVGPAQSRNGQMTQALLRLRQQEIVSVLRKGGVPAEAIRADAAEAPVDSVVMVVRAHIMALPQCPDWSADPRRGYNNQPLSNWGCATAVNFGIMLADPRDLIRGQGLSPADGERLARSIERYREDKTTPLVNENATSVSPQPKSGQSSGGG
jgi:pilus assembly protein CpaD